MLHGPQAEAIDLSFQLPSTCARQLRDGTVDIGLIPVGALLELDLAIFRGTGIACNGAVRSILLISKVPFADIRKLALDSSSRSSVLLARIVLARRYGREPELVTMAPDLAAMLDAADACLVIGDPALLLDPVQLRDSGFYVADLGEVWLEMTGLPMVFAVWAGRRDLLTPEREQLFVDSWRFGVEHLDEIVEAEYLRRSLTPEATRHYLTRNVVFELGEREYAGMQRYVEYASEVLGSASLEGSSVTRNFTR